MLLALLSVQSGYAQKEDNLHITKRYNLFFRINSDKIDENFKNNDRAIDQMKADI